MMLVSLIVFGKEIGMDFLSNLSFDKLGEILSYQPTAPMLFSSGLFFILFLLFSLFYIAFRKHTLARLIYVTLFSLYFYYKSSGVWSSWD